MKLDITPARAEVALVGDKPFTWYGLHCGGIRAQCWLGRSEDAPCYEMRIRVPVTELEKHNMTEAQLFAWMPGIATQFHHMVREEYGAKMGKE